LENNLSAVNARLTAVMNELAKLPKPNEKLSDEQVVEAEKRRTVIRNNLKTCEIALNKIEELYGLSDAERMEIARITAYKLAELRRLVEEQANAQSKSKSTQAAPKQDSAAAPPAAAPAPKSSATEPPTNQPPTNPQSTSGT
jgi:hypothetical protein